MCLLICVLPSVEGLKARSGLLLLRPLKCLSCLYQIPPAHLLIICLPAFVRPSLFLYFFFCFSISLFLYLSIYLFLYFFYQIASAQVPTSSSYFRRPKLENLPCYQGSSVDDDDNDEEEEEKRRGHEIPAVSFNMC